MKPIKSKPYQLAALTQKALDSFKYEENALDNFIKTFLEKHDKDFEDDDEIMFFTEVFSGCVYYRTLLNVLIECFYMSHGRKILKTQFNLYVVVSYLLIFRHEEFTHKQMQELALSSDKFNMAKFFTYLLSEKDIKGWVYDKWCETYDQSYVDKNFCWFFETQKEQLENIKTMLENAVLKSIAPKKETKPATVPKEFNLTKIRPRALQIPEKISKLDHTKYIPISNKKKPVYIKKLEEISKKNKEKAMEKLLEANRSQFNVMKPKLSQKSHLRMRTIEHEKESKLQFNNTYSTKMKNFEPKSIKMNTAAILREGLLYKKRDEEREKYLIELLQGSTDRKEYEIRQKKLQDEEKQKVLVSTQQKKLQSKITREMNVLRKKEKEEEKRKIAESVNEDLQKRQEDQMVVRLLEEQRMQELVEEVNKTHINAQEAKNKVLQENQAKVKQVNEETRELMQRALKEEEERLIQRSETIAAIRALEHLKPEKVVLFDSTSTAGHLVFNEMSLAELRERLATLREDQEREEEEKRSKIKRVKEEKNETMFKTLKHISLHRDELLRNQMKEREEKEKREKNQKKKVKEDESLIKLQKKLDMKRKKRMKIEKEEQKKIEDVKRFDMKGLVRERKKVERNRWKHMENSHMRLAKSGQHMTDLS